MISSGMGIFILICIYKNKTSLAFAVNVVAQ